MANRQTMAPGEWYHCYNRGVDKRAVFLDEKDYDRFLSLLFVCNGTNRIQIADRYSTRLTALILETEVERGDALVEIGAYTLMPNHVHLLLKQIRENGISIFMQKVFTGYTMYFNRKYGRAGALFSGSFKSKHVVDDIYLKQLIPYIWLNPIELFEPRWKEGLGNRKEVERYLLSYRYTSFHDFIGNRLESKLLGNSLSTLYDRQPSLQQLLKQAQMYYQEHQSPKV